MTDTKGILQNVTQHNKLTIRVSSNNSVQLPKEVSQKLLKPHRKQRYFFVFIIKGQSTHSVDLHETTIAAGQILFVLPHQIHLLPTKKNKIETSDLASLTLHNDPTWKYYPFKSAGYSVSKTALNSYTIMLAFGLKETNIKVNVVNPGHTATDFNNHRGDKNPEETAGVIVKYPTTGNDGPTGKFLNAEGEMPW